MQKVEIRLKDGQDAYELVSEYIKRFWERNTSVDTVVFSIETSYDGVDYCRTNEIATPTSDMEDVEYLNDWWEGEPYIKLLGIQSVEKMDISGGIYES